MEKTKKLTHSGKKKLASQRNVKRFREDPGPEDSHTALALRSPSRLGYTQDIPQIIETSFNSDSQDDSGPRDNDLPPLDLHQITAEAAPETPPSESENKQLLQRILDNDTCDFGQQTDFPPTPTSPLIPGATERGENATHEYVSSKSYFNTELNSPKHPYERTIFYVKNFPDQQLLSNLKRSPYSAYSSGATETNTPTLTSKTEAVTLTRLDSGYESQPQTIRISPRKTPISGRSIVQFTSPEHTHTMTTMSQYGNDLFSPLSSARKQEKVDLQRLNDRFSLYIQKVRQLNDQNNQLDAASFIRQTKVLEDEVTNLKNLYETELEVLRQELDGAWRERNNLNVQYQKNKQAAIDFESRSAVETDKNRRLMDDLNTAQRKINTLETELLNIKSGGTPSGDFQALQREFDQLIRENEDHKRRQEQESLLRAEADDRSHTLMKKLEFSEQVHAQQVAELRERLEQSQATIISFESRIRELSKNDVAIPDLLRQVREMSEQELHKYQSESEQNYNRNISALKLQMDNDAHTLESLSTEKSRLIGENGELHAKIRNLEGQIHNLTHQKTSVEGLLQNERSRFTDQIKTMEKKLRDMQEIIFDKMREANSARDVNIPLKAEIDALKLLLEEEERRLQLPLPEGIQQQQQQQQQQQFEAYSSQGATQASSMTQSYVPISVSQQQSGISSSPFITQQAGHSDIYTEAPMGNNDPYPLMPSAPPMSPNIQSDRYSATVPVNYDLETNTTILGAQKYIYETTPSVNRLQIEPSPPITPRAVGPISRAKSAPASRPNPQLVPTNLGHGKDYFDEMFKDLTRETIYSHTRPKSSPPKREEEKPETCSRERPRSSVYHDYTTSTSSAVGDIKILDVNQDGKFVRLTNEGKQELEFGGYMIQQNVGGHPVAVFRFPPRTKFPDNSTITVWAGTSDSLIHDPPKDFVWKEQMKWGSGPECTTILCKPNGQAVAWTTAAHRFTKNAFEDTSRPVSEVEFKDGDAIVQTTPDEPLTEMNVNLNEPKSDAVFLRREKQTPPSLAAQKHPHGSSPGQDCHPHSGQARPYTYGNDNSSVNRQSRSQTTRPDPVQGQPYAGGSANRLGSAPLRKHSTSNGNIRGSGALANRSNPGNTSPPPSPFQTPHKRFETGLKQLKSQHHQDYLPPMPRPPLFSAW